MRSRLLPLALSVLWLVPGARPAAAQILAQVVPVETTLVVGADHRARCDLTLRNLGHDAVVVSLRLADCSMSADGSVDILPFGYMPVTLQGMLSFEPAEMRLDPGASGFVHLEAALPDTGPATRYGMVLSRVRPAVPRADLPIVTTTELGTTVFLTRAGGVPLRGELAGMSVRPESDSTFRVGIRIWNGSERHFQAGGEIVIADSTGTVRARGRLAGGIVLPKALRLYTWVGDSRLPPGRYSVQASLEYGGATPVIGRTEIRWPLGRPMVLQQPPSASR